MSQMSGSYSTELLARQGPPPDVLGGLRRAYVEPLGEFRRDANDTSRQSWFGRFAPSLRRVLVDLPTDPAAIAALATGGRGSSVRPAPGTSLREPGAPDPFEPTIDEDDARARRLAGRILTGRVERGEADLTGTGDPYAALADRILLKNAEAVVNDPEAAPEAKAGAQLHIEDHRQRQQAARVDAERALAGATTDPDGLPARAVELWSQGVPQEEIDGLIGSAWTRLDPVNAQRMLDRLEIEADILRDQGKLTEAAGLLQARRAIFQGSDINVDANARPYDVMLDQIVRAQAKEGGAGGAFSAAGSDAFISTVRGIGRLMDVYPDQRDYLERLVGASYEENPVASFAGSFAGGMFDPVFFALSMGIAKAPVTAAARARYADDLVRSGVPETVAVGAAEKLTVEGLATHGLSRYFMNSEKAMRAKGILTRSRAPLTETQARALASIVWNASDGAVSNSMAEGIVAASQDASPLEIAIRAFQGGAMGLALGTGLSGIFSGAASLGRLLTAELPADTMRALDAGRAYIAQGGPEAEDVRGALEETIATLNRATRAKGGKLTQEEVRIVMEEAGFDPAIFHEVRRAQVIEKAAGDGVVDAGEFEEGAFTRTPATVDDAVYEAVPDAGAGMAASLVEETTTNRAMLAELAETRRSLGEARAEARTDPLTSLANRRGLAESAASMFERADSAGKPVSVVAFDMTNFKALNDVFGHDRGDEALGIIARVLGEELRTRPDEARGRTAADLDETGIVSRPGGDEFAALVYGADEKAVWSAIDRVEARIGEALDEAGLGHIDTSRGRRHVRLIGGVAVRGPGASVDLDTLLNAADQASIARKAQWKAEMGEPEGRFDLSEVESGGRVPEADDGDGLPGGQAREAGSESTGAEDAGGTRTQAGGRDLPERQAGVFGQRVIDPNTGEQNLLPMGGQSRLDAELASRPQIPDDAGQTTLGTLLGDEAGNAPNRAGAGGDGQGGRRERPDVARRRERAAQASQRRKDAPPPVGPARKARPGEWTNQDVLRRANRLVDAAGIRPASFDEVETSMGEVDFRFSGPLPGEIRTLLEGRFHLAPYFQANVKGGAGSDTMSDIGAERMIELAEEVHGRKSSQSEALVRQLAGSGDPDATLTAFMLDNRWGDTQTQQPIHHVIDRPGESLAAGSRFELRGQPFEVVEDGGDLFAVQRETASGQPLATPVLIYLPGLESIPVDAGTLRASDGAQGSRDTGEAPEVSAIGGSAGRAERLGRLAVSRTSVVDPSGAPEPRRRAGEAGATAKTKQGARLVEQIRTDPKGLRTGVRSIRQQLSDGLGVLEIMRREQTSARNPAHYRTSTHLIRSRNHSPGWIFHEHGHALSALLRIAQPDILKPSSRPGRKSPGAPRFVNPVADRALDLAYAPGSMASAKTVEEGFAEFARLFITDKARLAELDPTGEIERAARKALPDKMDLMDDARAAWDAHMARSLEARWRSHQNDIKREPASAKGVLRSAITRFAQRGYAMESLSDRVLREISKDADSIRAGWKRVAAVEKAIEGTGADARTTYASLLHIDQSVGVALEGTKADGTGGGLRVYSTHSIPDAKGRTAGTGHLTDAQVDDLRAAGFEIPDELAAQMRSDTPGQMLVLSARSVREAVAPVEGKWAEFETYAQMKATADRVMKRKGFAFQTRYEGETLADLLVSVREAEKANPEFLPAALEMQKIAQATLLLDLMSGERTLPQILDLANTWDFYLPLTRAGETGSPRVQTGPTTSPTSGIRRSTGSHNAAEPLLAAMHRKIAQSVSAYYWNRYMQTPLHLAARLRSMPDIPRAAQLMAERTMLPLSLDTKKMVDLSEQEQTGIIFDWIKNLAAMHKMSDAGEAAEGGALAPWPFDAFTPDDVLAGTVSAADIDIVVPGKTPIFRRVKPAAVNVVAPFIGGQRRYYQINDPLLFEVFASEDRVPGLLRAADQIVGQITPAWKNSITQTATFSLRSLARDYPTAMAFGRDGKALIPGYYHTLGFMQMATGKAPDSFSRPEIMSRTFRRVTSEDFIERRSRLMQELVGDLVPQGWKDYNGLMKGLTAPGIAVRVLLRPIELFQVVTGQRALATAAETAPRIGAFVAAKRRGLSDEAAQLAADTVTGYFAERPLSASAHTIYRMAGFLNPAVQITTQYARMLADPVPARAAARIGVLSASVAATTAVVWALKELLQTDEDLAREAERTEDERLTHMDIRGLRIPYDYGFAGGIQSFVYNSLDMTAGGLPRVERSKLAARVLKQSLPPHLTSPVEALPPIARAGLEVTTNYSFYRDKPLLPDYMRYLEPSERAFSTTPEIYRWFGRLTNQSPAQIEHLVRNGVSVQLADKIRALDRVAAGAGIEEIAEMPEIGRLFTRDPMGWNSRSVESVQELDRRYEALRKRLEAMEEERSADPEALSAMRGEVDDLAHFHGAMLDIERMYRDAKDAQTPDRRRELERKMVARAERAMRAHLDSLGE